MKPATKTRTQRRMEKKQAVIVLVLVLAVALASFTLGVVVGRRGAERDLANKQMAAERILVTKVPATAADEDSSAVQQESEAVAEQEAPAAEDAPKLTFYDKLAKEETAPLGSGINLPQQEKIEQPAAQPPIALPEKPIVKKELVAKADTGTVEKVAPPVASSAAVVGLPKVDPKGHYSVQVGSFGNAGDAGAFKKKLLDKGLPAYVAEADLGAKGIWYRVRLGPYTDAGAAKQVQELVAEKEKIKGFVSRQ